MPDRMASKSLSCCLQPTTRARSPVKNSKYAMRFMQISFSLPITHSKHDNNVKDGENCEGITKRAMDDVPETKYLFGPGQEQNSLGQGCLFSCVLNGEFQFRIARPKNPKK